MVAMWVDLTAASLVVSMAGLKVVGLVGLRVVHSVEHLVDTREWK